MLGWSVPGRWRHDAVQQFIRNEGVGGSNPSCDTKKSYQIKDLKSGRFAGVFEFAGGEVPGKHQRSWSRLASISNEGRNA